MAYRDIDSEIKRCRERIGRLNEWLKEHGAEARDYVAKFKERHEALIKLDELQKENNKSTNI